jgi:hypothetical protein
LIRSMLSAVLVLLLVVTTVGCVPVLTSPSPPNEPPVAYIDSISATTVTGGQTVTFTGHGTDVGGSVVAYQWTVKPSVNSLKFTPERIFEGEATTLTWDVSGATAVTIEPDIGNVPLVGNRLINPKASTIYTLTASNQAGVVTENIRIIVTAMPKKVVELFSIVGEEGTVNSNGVVDSEPKAGIPATAGAQMEAFFSFDISSIPDSATITSASIDITNYIVHGQPVGLLGALAIFDDQYGVLESKDYIGSFTLDALVYTYTQPIEPYTSSQLIGAVQMQVADKSPRFQVRVQFEKFFFSSGGANYLEFIPGKTKLTVSYE